MPWRDYTVAMGRQTLIKIIDNRGQEVPLLDIVAFNVHMSQLLTRQPETKPE